MQRFHFFFFGIQFLEDPFLYSDSIVGALLSGRIPRQVSSVADMVAQCLAILGTDGRIASLTLSDHGGSDAQKLGSDIMTVKRIPTDLQRLRGKFVAGARVYLEGCFVAEGSPDWLWKISAALGGIPVVGGTGFQYPMPPGLENDNIECVMAPNAETGSCTWIKSAGTRTQLRPDFRGMFMSNAKLAKMIEDVRVFVQRSRE